MGIYTTENGIDLQNVDLNLFLNLGKKQSPLKIYIDGKEFVEFNGLRLSYAIDSGCAAFSFDTILYPSKGLSNKIKPFGNELIIIKYNYNTIFIGNIEKITTGYSNSGSNINIQGRSRSAILLDTQIPAGQAQNTTLVGLSQNLGYYNLVTANPNEQYPLFDYDYGDNAFDILTKYASQKGLWAIPKFDGTLSFVKIENLTDTGISIEDGNQNVLSITASYDVTKRFSEYIGFKKDKTPLKIEDKTVIDRGKKYFRGNDIVSDLRQVAKLGRSKSISESMNFSVILSTWEWNKSLFQPGILIEITSPMNLIYKKSKFCVKQVDYTYDINSGFITELQLALPSVYTLEDPKTDFFQKYPDVPLTTIKRITGYFKIPDNKEVYDSTIKTIGKLF
jgi:prophage tail gpP-like protein